MIYLLIIHGEKRLFLSLMPIGIIERYYKQHGGDVSQYVSVKGTSAYLGYAHNLIKNLLSWNNPINYRYFSEAANNAYVNFTFLKGNIRARGYSIKTHYDGTISFPKKWKFYGCNGDLRCFVIDEQSNSSLNSFGAFKYYRLKPRPFNRFMIVQEENYYSVASIKTTLAFERLDFYEEIRTAKYVNACINVFLLSLINPLLSLRL